MKMGPFFEDQKVITVICKCARKIVTLPQTVTKSVTVGSSLKGCCRFRYTSCNTSSKCCMCLIITFQKLFNLLQAIGASQVGALQPYYQKIFGPFKCPCRTGLGIFSQLTKCQYLVGLCTYVFSMFVLFNIMLLLLWHG